jgi:hypothetical protein
MKIFDIVSGEVVIDPSRLVIPEFKKLWLRDKNKDKRMAMKEISYITFLFDLSADNPYRGYTEYERDTVLRKDIFNDANWKPDAAVLDAINKFQKLMETTNVRVLLGAKQAAEELAKWFRQVKCDAVDDRGNSLFSVTELSRNLKEVGNIIKSLAQLEEMVRREQVDKSTTRGGSDIGMYEIPRSTTEYGI